MAGAFAALLLETNILVLAAVGLFDRSLIGRKSLGIYTAEDFDLLTVAIADYERNLTTPHVLAEVSNLADQSVPRHATENFAYSLRNGSKIWKSTG